MAALSLVACGETETDLTENSLQECLREAGAEVDEGERVESESGLRPSFVARFPDGLEGWVYVTPSESTANRYRSMLAKIERGYYQVSPENVDRHFLSSEHVLMTLGEPRHENRSMAKACLGM